MKGRPPSALDIERMKKALALVVAYDIGTEENEFAEFKQLAKNADEKPEKMIEALSMFSWMLIKSFEESGADKDEVFQWYGMRFAEHAERLEE